MEPSNMRSFEHCANTQGIVEGVCFPESLLCRRALVGTRGLQCFGSGAAVRCGARRVG